MALSILRATTTTTPPPPTHINGSYPAQLLGRGWAGSRVQRNLSLHPSLRLTLCAGVILLLLPISQQASVLRHRRRGSTNPAADPSSSPITFSGMFEFTTLACVRSSSHKKVLRIALLLGYVIHPHRYIPGGLQTPGMLLPDACHHVLCRIWGGDIQAFQPASDCAASRRTVENSVESPLVDGETRVAQQIHDRIAGRRDDDDRLAACECKRCD